MVTVTVTDGLKAFLSTINEEALLRDIDGRLLGRYVPGGLTDEEVYARACELLDIEEAKRRKVAERGLGRPLSAVLSQLPSAGTQP